MTCCSAADRGEGRGIWNGHAEMVVHERLPPDSRVKLEVRADFRERAHVVRLLEESVHLG